MLLAACTPQELPDLEHVDDIAASPIIPPRPFPEEADVVKINLVATEVISEIEPGVTYAYWTYNNTVPGPFLRVKQNDTVELTLTNHPNSTMHHNIDIHAVTGPGGGATVTHVKPGETKTFRFKALNPGLYVYHCAMPRVAAHMANGMYGLILVEPPEGLPAVDKEYYLVQGELYPASTEHGYQPLDEEKLHNEQPEYIVFNGRVKALEDHALEANTGETVRLYVGNGGVSKISSFHVIGEIFDTVYHEAGTLANHNVQTTLIPAGGASIVEFTTDVPGTYTLVDHALTRLDKGAWGALNVK